MPLLGAVLLPGNLDGDFVAGEGLSGVFGEVIGARAFGAEQEEGKVNVPGPGLGAQEAFVSFTGGCDQEILEVLFLHIDDGRKTDPAFRLVKADQAQSELTEAQRLEG